MKKPKTTDLDNRRSAAADAKAALLQAHRDAKEAAEPTLLARQEERLAVSADREQRRAQRAQAKIDAEERVQAAAAERQAAADAAARAEVEARGKGLNDLVSRVVSDEAARKAQRDQRYAERKSRQR